ncbi:MAG: tripartite tricarboxylate transporter substrate binding protein [Burkholderiales bacterium]|nr:tripartite tricarboxylate transporter substrate binding protein [Burkholderiales bacterium]
MPWPWLFAVMSLCALSPGLQAQNDAADFPVRNMRFVVPFGPGGGPDIIGRRLAQGLAERTGRNVIVDNRVGATGMLGMHEVARATPDGYSFGLLNAATPVAQVIMAKPPLDLARDVAPVVQLLRYYTIVVVRPELAARTAKDLVDMMKERPGAYSFGSGGNGTPAHLAGELFVRSVGAKAAHVPYKQITTAISDVVRGDVLFICSAVANVAALIQSGRLRAIGVVGPRRIAAFPSVPSFVELGLPDPNVVSWTGVVAPAATPLPLRQKLHRLLRESAAEPAHAKAFEQLGLEAAEGTLEQFGATIRAEVERWGKFVREANIRID